MAKLQDRVRYSWQVELDKELTACFLAQQSGQNHGLMPRLGISYDTVTPVTASKLGEKAYTEIRRFVVVREMQEYCLCLSLSTYGG